MFIFQNMTGLLNIQVIKNLKMVKYYVLMKGDIMA